MKPPKPWRAVAARRPGPSQPAPGGAKPPKPWRAVATVLVGAALAATAAIGCTESGPDSPAGAAASDMDSTDSPADAPADPAPVTRLPLDDPPDPGPVPDDHGLSEADLAAAVESSVRVAAPACRGIVREGSGFGVRDGDLIVTNAHLMIGMTEPEVELFDGRKLAAVPVAFDPVNDLAVLRADGAGLAPLPLSDAVPDGTIGAVLAWEAEGSPDPTPFRIDRPVTVRTETVNGDERIERPSWLLAADTEVGDSGAALVVTVDGRLAAVGVAWGASRRGGGGVAYATRAGALAALLASSDLDEPVAVPDCG